MNKKQINKLLLLINRMAEDLLDKETDDVKTEIKKDVVEKAIKMFYDKNVDEVINNI